MSAVSDGRQPDRGPEEGSLSERVRRTVLGAPRDVTDTSQLHKMSLIAFLAWVGLGADGLSSSAYGPEEAFRTLGEHTYLAIALAVATALTVLIISASYSSIIEQFPTGGGGYVVASHLLGPRIGVISGCALVVDYVLTITVSIASGGDAVYSFLPQRLHHLKLPSEFLVIGLLIALNLRGVKESIKTLMPIFLVFLGTHALLIGWSVLGHLGQVPVVAHQVSRGFSSGLTTLGLGGMAVLLMRAYALGAAAQHPPRRRQDDERHPGRERVRHLEPGGDAARLLAGAGHPDLGRPAAGGRGAGGFHRRAAGDGEHGHRLLLPPPLRRPLRAADDAERRPADGRRGVGDAGLHPRQHPDPGVHVFDQRVPDLHPVAAQHEPLLVGEEGRDAAPAPPRDPWRRAGDVRQHPGHHPLRALHPRRLGDGAHHLDLRGALLW